MNVKSNTRVAFHCQPSHYLVLDVGHYMNIEELNIVTTAVQNILTLVCSLYGGIRVPGFGLSIINKEYNNLFKVSPVRGNYTKIIKAFTTLKNTICTSEKTSLQEFKDNVKLAIIKILNDHASTSDFIVDATQMPTSQFVFISLVTKQDGSKIQDFLEEVLCTISTENLKKVQIIEIVNENEFSSAHTGKIVDLIQLPALMFKLEQFFKMWLLDCDTSQEHVRIQLCNLCIKCDIADSAINPFLVPFGHCFQIQTDYFKGSGVIKFPAKSIPVYELEVISRISGNGLCESLLFGQSQRLVPTKCWQLEGNNYITNMHYFQALCKSLSDTSEYLLTTVQCQETEKICGYFIIIPGINSLLLRAVSPSELILPNVDIHPDANAIIQKEYMIEMEKSLKDLPVVEELFPEKINSGLYPALKKNLLQKTSSGNQHPDRTWHPALDAQAPKRRENCVAKKRPLF